MSNDNKIEKLVGDAMEKYRVRPPADVREAIREQLIEKNLLEKKKWRRNGFSFLFLTYFIAVVIASAYFLNKIYRLDVNSHSKATERKETSVQQMTETESASYKNKLTEKTTKPEIDPVSENVNSRQPTNSASPVADKKVVKISEVNAKQNKESENASETNTKTKIQFNSPATKAETHDGTSANSKTAKNEFTSEENAASQEESGKELENSMNLNSTQSAVENKTVNEG
jgi:hypothetical protein